MQIGRFVLTFGRTNLLIAVILVLTTCSHRSAEHKNLDTEGKLRAVADAVLMDATFKFTDQDGRLYDAPEEAPAEAELIPESGYTDWRYWNGVLNVAMRNLATVLTEMKYAHFVSRQIAFCFDHQNWFQERHRGENKWNYPFGQFFIMEELDDCGAMGASVIDIMRDDPQDRYKAYIDQAAAHIMTRQGRLEDGTLVRHFPRRWTLWADDLYMSVAFLARMGEFTGDTRYLDDAVNQVIRFNHYLFDEEKGLMHHCWFSDTQTPGIAFWGRANGWAMLAHVDLLDRLPESHTQRDTLLTLLRRHIQGIMLYQSDEGLWHQLLDKPDSYLETSCSSIFTYVLARAVNKGYIETEYASAARRGWKGVMTRIHPDGQFEGVCTGTGVGDDLEFYYNRPAPLSDGHGTGFILLAGAEILSL